ncbi:MAG: hypothetical protein ACREP9_19370, partial [Candidatus Dormibacteraceae bacterium]
ARVQTAYNNGIYVGVMLFQGWSISEKPGEPGNPWPGHPFNSNNNVNGINGDPSGTGQGLAVHTISTTDPNIMAVNALQEAYIRKVVDTLDGFDNVLYEISNEDSYSSADVAWQYAMINYLKNYEATKAKHHPVGMTALLSDSSLFSSPADWVSPNANYSLSGTAAATGNKVVLTDTDHIYGQGGDASWIWESFTKGTNPIYMDSGNLPNGYNSTEDSARLAMGEVLAYSRRMDMNADVPRGDVVSTGYGLANPGYEYLAFQPSSNTAFTVNMLAGTYSYEWLNVGTNTVSTGTVTVGAGNHSFTPPILRIRRSLSEQHDKWREGRR